MAQYSPLRSGISEDNHETHVESSTRRSIYLILRVVVFCLALYGSLDLGRKAWLSLSRRSSCSCGQSPAEAIARGCKFDPYAAAWLPDHCRDDSQIREFGEMEALGNSSWNFYDYSGRIKLTVEEVAMMAGVVSISDHQKGEAMVKTTTKWHHMHCLYILLKAARLKRTGLAMEPRYTKESHTTHCAKSIYGWISAQPAAHILDSESEVDIYA
ncbi:hypothetical protein F5884DRAFT_119836 [Xylogone sp. PMI_703]|nr:hypothetical protein F5884DRAFT_119836 [Xylogone sp. PMI_703]